MKHLFALSSLVLALVLGGCDKPEDKAGDEKLEVLFSAPTFSLTNQNGQPFGTPQLTGKTWIATLFFTTCPGPCPMMAERLRDIQGAVNDPNVMMVSISCDPENDNVARLAEYAKAHHADPTRWLFLTGKMEDVKAVAKGLNLSFDPATAEGPITHSVKFLLIDKHGQVRGLYSHDDEESMAKLKQDAPRLAREG